MRPQYRDTADEAHRRECAPLRAEVRAMIAAEKRSA